ncbi:AsmA family protein [Maricaulis sp. CAU 1757]
MFRFLLIVLLVVAGLAGILVWAPQWVPDSLYRDRLEAAAEGVLHRDVELDGPLSFRLVPRVEFTARDVTIANATGYGETPLARMAEMRVVTGLGAILDREIDIHEFILVEPVIALEQRRDGNNWTFRPDGEGPAPAADSDGGFRRQPGALPIDARFADLRIVDGQVRFTDASGTDTLDGLDLVINLPGLDEEAAIEGGVTANGEALAFAARIGSLRDFFEGRETAVRVDFEGDLAQARFDGHVLESADIRYAGDIEADIASLTALARFAGTPPAEPLPVDRFSASGVLSGQPGRLQLDNARLTLDELAARGALGLATGGARPAVSGTLAMDRLDLDPFLPAEAAGSARPGLEPWSDSPLNMDFMGLLDADLELAVTTLTYRDLEFGDVALDVQLSDRRLLADLDRFALYDGEGQARLVANARTAMPSFSLNARLDGLDTRRFLVAAADLDRLAGTGRLELDVSTEGNSQRALMQGLDGRGRLDVADGALIGLNIAETIRNVGGVLQATGLPQTIAPGLRLPGGTPAGETDTAEPVESGADSQTDFSSLGASLAIRNGVISNDDLLMLSPLLRVTGSGQIDLPQQSMDYRLQPRAVASLQGQGGATDLRGITVPIRVSGAINAPRIGVDTQAVIQALVRGALNSGLGGEAGRTPEEAVRDTVLDAIGLGRRPEGEPDSRTDTERASDFLRSILGNRGPAQRDEPAETPPADEDTGDTNPQ